MYCASLRTVISWSVRQGRQQQQPFRKWKAEQIWQLRPTGAKRPQCKSFFVVSHASLVSGHPNLYLLVKHNVLATHFSSLPCAHAASASQLPGTLASCSLSAPHTTACLKLGALSCLQSWVVHVFAPSGKAKLLHVPMAPTYPWLNKLAHVSMLSALHVSQSACKR